MATPTLLAQLSFILNVQYVDTDDINEARGTISFNLSDDLTSGTTTDKADLLWWDTRTLAATSEDLDLAAGLTDTFGNVLTFVEIVGLAIKNTSTTTAEILAVGGAAGNQFINWVANSSDIVNIDPDGILFLWSPLDGYTVTAGTGDLLKIDAGAATITYEIVIIGRSA